MRIADKIASRVLDKLETFGIVPTKAQYLDVECAIADAIADEFQRWLKYEVDLLDFDEDDNAPSECPQCGHVNKLGEDCKKCGHSWI